MTDQNEQPQGWRDRLFGTEADPVPDGAAAPIEVEGNRDESLQTQAESHSDAERGWQVLPDDESAKTDEYRPTPASAPAPESEVEPQVVLPSSLRGDNPTGEMDQFDEPSPELVEPARPQLSLRRRERAIEDAKEAERAVMGDQEPTPEAGAQTEALPQPEAEPEQPPATAESAPTQAMPTAVAEPEAPTRDLDAPPFAEAEERFFVERPEEPRKRGARGVGVGVAVLSTVVLAAVLGLAYYGVLYLFSPDFDAAAIAWIWLYPPLVFAVVAFLVAYLIWTLIVNRAGWWAHVLGGFLIALVPYAAAVWGPVYVAGGGWEAGFGGMFEFSRAAVAEAVLVPYAVVTFVLAREVPIWLGGIVARRGRTQRLRYEAEMAEYERKLDAETE